MAAGKMLYYSDSSHAVATFNVLPLWQYGHIIHTLHYDVYTRCYIQPNLWSIKVERKSVRMSFPSWQSCASTTDRAKSVDLCLKYPKTRSSWKEVVFCVCDVVVASGNHCFDFDAPMHIMYNLHVFMIDNTGCVNDLLTAVLFSWT